MDDILETARRGIGLPKGEEYQPEPVAEKPKEFVTLTRKELKEMNLPPVDYVLYPWLPCGGLATVSAPAGIGKTYLTMGISKAVCEAGKILRWTAPFRRSVLYVDGEMRLVDMKRRMETFSFPENFHLLPLDAKIQPEELQSVNLAYNDHQKAIIKTIQKEKTELVILDNRSCLYQTDRPNSQESFDPMKNFLLTLRRMGVAVILVDHEGKGDNVGSPRGTSAKQDILDTAITLRRPSGYQPSDGAAFDVRFLKSRGMQGEDAQGFTAKLERNLWIEWDTDENEDASVKELSERARRKIEGFRLFDEGKSVEEVVRATEASSSTVYRWHNEWKQQHPFDDVAHPSYEEPSEERKD